MQRMAPQTSIRLTYEDYAAIPDDGRRHEIIDGEHLVNPAPNLRHQGILVRLTLAIGNHVVAHNLGHVFPAPTDVLLTEHDVVEPDLIFISNARAAILTVDNIKGVPDLLIEVLSPGTRRYDKRIKFETYERAGVPEYWIVDPEDEVVEIYRRRADRFVRIDAADAVTTPLLPNFSLPLPDLFT